MASTNWQDQSRRLIRLDVVAVVVVAVVVAVVVELHFIGKEREGQLGIYGYLVRAARRGLLLGQRSSRDRLLLAHRYPIDRN